MDKKKRNEMYMKILQKLEENHRCSPYVCHVVSYLKYANLYSYEVAKLKKEFKELSMFFGSENGFFDDEKGFTLEDGPNDKVRSVRETILMFAIEMTK